ncbi:MAG: PGPGW domain-containing protein [Candidatus Binatia bacterium]
MASRALRHARRLIILVVGLTVLAIGTAMIALPGPAFIVIPVGLAILATEFVWAERLLHRLREGGRRLIRRSRRKKAGHSDPDNPI